VRGLNLALSIFVGLSFGKVVESWVGVVGGKFFCVVDGAKFPCVINVNSWCPSSWH